jgi:striatin 1/3/4
MIKLWNLSDMDRKFAESSSSETSNMEPYLTLRGHTGPLLCVTGINDSSRKSENKNLLFTAGIEGNIRVWNVP